MGPPAGKDVPSDEAKSRFLDCASRRFAGAKRKKGRRLAPLGMTRFWGSAGISWGDLATGEAVAGGFFEGMDFGGESLCGLVDCTGGVVARGGLLNFGYERGADDGGVGEATEDGDVAGQRNAEADSDGKLRDAAGAAEKGGKIVWQRVLCSGHAGAGDEVEESGGDSGDFGEALVCGSRCAEENGVEMMRGEDAAIVVGLLGSEIGDENAVGACVGSGSSEFFEAHLQDGIVVAEEDEGNLAGLANLADEVDDLTKSGAGFESAFRGALDGGAVGERIAEGNAKFDDIGARIRESENKFVRGGESGIAGGDVGDDAEFARFAQPLKLSCNPCTHHRLIFKQGH